MTRSGGPAPAPAMDPYPSAAWRAKVAASRRSEALAQEVTPRLPESLRPYLRRLLMQDEYPGSLRELIDLSIAHRANLLRLHLHGCAPIDEHEEARSFGPAFEEAIARLMASGDAPVGSHQNAT